MCIHSNSKITTVHDTVVETAIPQVAFGMEFASFRPGAVSLIKLDFTRRTSSFHYAFQLLHIPLPI